MIKLKYSDQFKKSITYLLFVSSVPIICILPKINIFYLPGFWQGIQIFDILIFFFMIFVIFNFQILKINFKGQFTNVFIFFPYIIFTSLIAIILINNDSFVHQYISLNISIIVFIRFIEYLFFVILALNFFYSKKNLNIFFQLFIFINFIFAILQEYNLIGYVNSRGFFAPGDDRIGGRPMGLTGGPWELGATTSLAFFGLFFINKKIFNLKIVFYLILTILCLYFAETRSNFIGFVVALLFLKLNYRYLILLFLSLFNIYMFYLFNYTLNTLLIYFIFSVGVFILYKKINFVLIYILAIPLLNILFFNIVQHSYFIQKLLSIDFIYLLNLMYEFLVFETVPHTSNTPDIAMYYSIILRLKYWLPLLVEYKSSYSNIIFGMGNQYIYYESFILRCIFAFGLLGTFIIIFLSRKLPLFFIIYTILAGITFDLYFSSKVFFMVILFFISFKNSIEIKKLD